MAKFNFRDHVKYIGPGAEIALESGSTTTLSKDTPATGLVLRSVGDDRSMVMFKNAAKPVLLSNDDLEVCRAPSKWLLGQVVEHPHELAIIEAFVRSREGVVIKVAKAHFKKKKMSGAEIAKMLISG